ncbi:MAG TPA: M28 family peptidase [Bacteroidales bacterium]|nr:M28 family peptidase [Bacteroidales bacterium]
MKFLILILIFLLVRTCAVQPDNPEITPKELKEHEAFLASDRLTGRYPGTEGDSLSSEYIRAHFKAYKLELLFDEGFQEFEVTGSTEAGEGNVLITGSHRWEYGKDYTAFPFSGSDTVASPVVFAGYGFSIVSDTFSWDDYRNLDIKGKWCLILRGEPEKNPLPSSFARFTDERTKAMVAADKGASGVLFVSGSQFDRMDELVPMRRTESRMQIPVLHISRKVADDLLEGTGKNIVWYEMLADSCHCPVGFFTGKNASARTNVLSHKVLTNNVAGLLRGNDPILRDEIIIIGAHKDHLGMGGPGSGSRVPDTLAVHNGADDNASGVSLLLELAEKFAAHRNELKRSILFVAFGAEEMGILGSTYFTNHPPVDIHAIKAMINLDMVGRLRDDHSLQIGGTGTSAESETLIREINRDSVFRLMMSPEGIGPSDHAAFYSRNIPVFFLTTGAHTDYHTPYDDADKLNYDGMVKVGNYVYALTWALDTLPKGLTFKESGPSGQQGGRPRFKVTLGIMPDFTSTDNNGLRVDFVTRDKPAWRGGMKKGDIITALDGKPVHNIEEYMYRLSKLSAGQLVEVEVMRDGKRELLFIQL